MKHLREKLVDGMEASLYSGAITKAETIAIACSIFNEEMECVAGKPVDEESIKLFASDFYDKALRMALSSSDIIKLRVIRRRAGYLDKMEQVSKR